MSANPNIIQDPSLDYLSQISLFRNVFENYTKNHMFNYFLISLDLDVNALLSSPYTTNSNIIFLLSNNRQFIGNTQYYNDLISQNMIDSASLVLMLQDNSLILTGGNKLHQNVYYQYKISLGGQNVSQFSKIYLSLLVDTDNAIARMTVVADNLLIPQTYNAHMLPLFFDSQIYTHPSLGELILVLVNPRLEVDYWTHGNEHFESQYPTSDCTSGNTECNICGYSVVTETAYCLSCRDGYQWYNNGCLANDYYQN